MSLSSYRTFLTLALICFIWPACQKNNTQNANSPAKPSGPTRFELMDPAKTGFSFSNTLNESSSINYMNFNYLYIGGAVGIGDFNNDGWQDVYMSAIIGDNKLFINKGNFQFEETAAKAGVTASFGIKTGVAVVDINNDGWPDIYQCRTGAHAEDRGNLLFINNHDGTFTESAAAYGLDTKCSSTHANFFDFDNDGDLDLYLLNHPVDFSKTLSLRVKQEGKKVIRILEPENEDETDRFYRNNGNGTFTDITKQAGIQDHAWGLSTTVMDFNRDGYQDIYVANDYIEPDNLYINNRNGTFTDRMQEYLRHSSHFSMGSDAQDINNDGLYDLMSLDMNGEGNERQKMLATAMTPERYQLLVNYGYGHQVMRNMLQLNNGNGTFSEIGCLAGVSSTDWSWAPLMYDYDNDGYRDIYISNGHRREVTDMDYMVYTVDSLAKTGKQINDIQKYLDHIPSHEIRKYMYRNRGDLSFEDVTDAWGLGDKALSNGAVEVDLDNDGDLDLVVSNASRPAFLYRNKTREMNGGNYLQVQLEGSAKNTRGIGATVQLRYGTQQQIADEQPIRGFLSTNSPILHFGLGALTAVDHVSVQWPDGKVQTLDNVPANQILKLKYADAKPGPSIFKSGNTSAPLFADITTQTGVNFVHKENDYYDFNRERLIPHKYSNLGPCLVKGDVNGDGLEDFYVGGAFLSTGALFVQGKNGRFSSVTAPFTADTIHEDTGALFFDADGDGDQDLYVVSGGNEAAMNNKVYQDRLYINDGKGNLQYDLARLPTETSSGSCVAAYDYDHDGDLDLFVGGGIVPGQFPTAPFSFVLQNNKGNFSAVTPSVAPELSQLGLVTDIIFADLDKDGQDEMIVSGEWMAIEVFKWQGGKFAKATAAFGLDGTKGWWGCVTAADMDGDGDIDLIAGNLGLNTRYRASAQGPLRLYAKDFDGNGSIDPIMAWYENGKYYPVPFRDALIKQIPEIKKKFGRYAPYARATIQDVYPQSVLDAAQKLEASELRSCYFENNNGHFTARPLPNEAQFAPVKSILVYDINGDGKPDALLCGNDYGPEVETGVYDASNGLVLLGDGKGNFQPVPGIESGFWATREARHMVRITLVNKKKAVVVANNNSGVQVFGEHGVGTPR